MNGDTVTTDGKPRGRRWLWRIVAGLIAALIAAVVAAAVAYPVAAAAACPGCYGLRRAGPDVYVDGGATPQQRRQIVDMTVAARQRVRDFLGPPHSSPRVLVCLSADCYARVGGGGEKGRTLGEHVVALSPSGANVVIASHEMTHAELFHRLGWRYTEVPAWFHEGLAVLVSDDRRYLTAKPAGERCPVDHAGALAATRTASRDAGQDFYRDGACVVDRWVATHGGPTAVHDLIRRLQAGEPFTSIVPTT